MRLSPVIAAPWLSLLLFCSPPGSAGAAPAAAEVCTACHGTDGMGVGELNVPIIAAIPPVHIKEALYAYQDEARQCANVPAMCEAVSELSEDEINELASYYGDMVRGSSSEPFDAALADVGRDIHERLCSRCHVPPDDEDVGDALGFPLHGQRSAYLRYALDAYRDGSREQLLRKMAEKLSQLSDDDVDALINYYTSYRNRSNK